jgi:hypothetical protein
VRADSAGSTLYAMRVCANAGVETWLGNEKQPQPSIPTAEAYRPTYLLVQNATD